MKIPNPIPIITDLSNVTPQNYAQAEAYIQALLTESFPARDFGIGSGLYWTVVVPAAVAIASNQENSYLTANSLNLSAVKAFPGFANQELADLLLSNYYVSRQQGAVSRGTVTYVVNRQSTYAVLSGATLTAYGLQYTVPTSIFAYPDATQVTGASDRVLVKRSDGNYQFSVPVEAVDPGSAYFVPSGAPLAPSSPPSGVISVVAETDIAGGVDEQTLADLMSQVPTKFAASTWGSRATVRALITDLYPQAHAGIVGFGDPEMVRDRHNPLAISLGGFADVWSSTQQTVGRDTRTMKASYIEDSEGGFWRIVLGVDDAAGIYQVRRVSEVGGPSLEITSQTRTWDVPALPGAPLIYTADEAAFTSYQILTIDFLDDEPESDEEEKEYEIGVIWMPGIKDLTDQLTSPEALDPTVNVLVHGVIPCLTSVSLKVRLLDADFEDTIDEVGIREAIVSRINRIALGFGVMSASVVLDSIMDFLSGRSDVSGTTVTLRGEIIAPDGANLILGDDRELVIPDLPTRQISKNTTKFFTDNSLIDVRFERVST